MALSRRLVLLLVVLTAAPTALAQSFSASGLQGESLANPTSLEFGPDDRLYVSEQDGDIHAFTVVRNGVDDYEATASETISLIKTGVPNHDDDGTANTTSKRQVTGILATGTATTPVLYVTSSDWRIAVGDDSGLDTNSGVLTRLTCTGGIVGGVCQSWDAVDLVRGLPRSEENHSTNGLDLDEASNVLYLMNGGHANKGAPSNNFSGTPEYFLSAAMLSVDLDALEAMPVYADPRNGRSFVYDLPTLDDPTRANIDNTDPDFPYPAGHPRYGYEMDPGDPFGGNNGLNMAIPEPGGPVQVYSPGYRNAYDVVLTESGDLYTWDNGPNGGWGGTARIYDSAGTYKGYDTALYDPGAGDYCTNEINEDGSNGHGDVLKFVSGPGYYGGHQAPIRAFPVLSGIYNYVKDGSGNWVHDGPPGGYDFSALLPTWLSLTDFPDNPVECAYTVQDDDLETVGSSTNGLTEYTASNFSGAMAGDLVVASFNGNVYRCKPDGAGGLVDLPGSGSGTANGLCEVLFGGFGSQPLDVTAQGDTDVFAGTIWAATYGANNITVFEPQDFGACNTDDPDGDADGDGYTNGDEADNGTNPCNGGDFPDDNDGDFVSDLNDPDDDNDGTLDVDDPFALDPDDGTATSLPISYSLFNNDPGTGLFGLGFTGLMLPEDGATTWLDLFDEENLAAGGTAGLLTVEAVPYGDAYQGENAAEYGFLFGVDADANSAPFVVQARLLPPYFAVGGSPSPPENWQQFGFFIGTGGQDDYLKVVFNANDGVGGVEVVTETGGSAGGSQYSNADWGGADILASSSVDFSLLVDPQSLTAQPRVELSGNGAVYDLGSPLPVPAAWLSPTDGQGLAVGTFATANSPGDAAPEFGATWDYFEVYEAPSEAKALVQVTPNGGINASTYGANSFSIENLSTGATITSVAFDTGTAVLPDIVFDPTGGAGDTTFKDFTPDTDGGTSQSTHTFGAPFDGGYQTLTVDFDDFDPGETFKFSVDMDPTSINGTSAPGPGESGSVSGLELSGATVTVSFSDGSVHTAALFRGAEGTGAGTTTTLGGGENIVRSPAPAQPQISVADVTLAPVSGLPSHFQAASVGQASQTVHVDGPVGAEVRLLVLEAALFEPSGGGNDIDPFEANSVTAVSEQTATITGPGGVDFPVTLAPIDASSDPDATTTLNYLVATVEDPADGMTGLLSDVAILAYDPSLQPVVLFRVNAGGAAVPAIDGEIDWEGDTGANPSPYVTLGTCGNCNKTSGYGAPTSVDPSVDQGTTPLALFEAERWDHPDNPEMLWSFPTGDGEFTVRLYLMNGYDGTSLPGERVFDINVEGGALEVDDLDLSGQYGHKVAVMLDFPVTVADGALDIEFLHQVENPLINAIEVLGSGGPVANNPPVLDPIGDQFSYEGDTPDLTVTATDPEDDGLTYSATGLPTGLDIEPTNGHVYGTIAAGAALDSPFTVTVTVTDDGDPMLSDSETLTWTVAEPGADVVLYRVNNGGPELPSADGSGPPWAEDQVADGANAGGTASAGTPSPYVNSAETDFTFGTSNTVTPNGTVPASVPAALFQLERYDPAGTNVPEMEWDFPVTPGSTIEVRLYFAEVWTGASSPGVRVFDVEVEGAVPAVFDDIDPYVGAGNAINTGFMLSHTLTMGDGNLDLNFLHVTQNPALKGIEVLAVGGTANAAPVLDPIDDVAVTEGEEAAAAISATDANDDLIALSIEVVDDSDSSVVPDTEYTFSDNGDGTGSFSWMTAPGDAGTYTATVTADDGTDTDTEAFAITVEEHLPAITITAPADGATVNASDVTVSWTTTGVLATDHVHVVLDGDFANYIGGQPLDGSYTLTGLADGPHTITVQVADMTHAVYPNPEATDEVGITVDTSPPPAALFRVNAGGPQYTDGAGEVWEADAYFTGGTVYAPGALGSTEILNTDDDVLYRSERYGNPFSYAFAVPNGDYDLELHFAEIYLGVNSNGQCPGDDCTGLRVFDVEVEGVVVLDDYDIWATAGASLTALVETIEDVTVADGSLDVTFLLNPGADNAKVSALAVFPAGAANSPPLVTNPGAQTNAVGDVVSLQVEASDPDGGPEALTYLAVGLPPGLTIDANTGLISGTVAAGAFSARRPDGPQGQSARAAGRGARGADGAVAGGAGTEAFAEELYPVTVTVSDGADATEVSFTWTVTGLPEPSALVLVNPGGGLGASTYSNNSFQLLNTGDVDITGVSIDVSTAYLRDIVFDPNGTAGDATAKCLTPNNTVGTPGFVAPTDPCVDPFSQPHDADGDGTGDPADGYDVLSLAFTDFNGGEQFNFSVDQDPNSIKGDSNSGDAGSVSGFENIGATVTVTFADGTVLTANLFDEGSLGGSQAVVAEMPPAPAPVLGTSVVLTPLDGDRAGATVTDLNQTLTVTGPAGAAFTLLQVDARLYIDDPAIGGGYDIDLFEANEAVAKALYTGTLDGAGQASVPVTLLQTAGTGGAPDSGINHFLAVTDGTDGQTSATSNVIVLDYDPTGGGGPTALIEVNANTSIDGSTWNNGSFVITNSSTGSVLIESISFDLSSALFMDLVFDPLGEAGDTVGKCLQIDGGGTETGYVVPADACVDPFSLPHDGDGNAATAEGYDAMAMAFTDFGPGETLSFSVDIDPTSIKGDSDGGDAGSVSGLELAGSTVTVTLNDGTTHTVTTNLFSDGSGGGSAALVKQALAPAPVLGVDGVPLTVLDPVRSAATVTDAAQSLTIAGTPGATVELLHVDARLYIEDSTPDADDPPDGIPGFDLDPFEANQALAVSLVTTVTLDGSGQASVPVTLLQTASADAGPDGGLNHFLAVETDADGDPGRTSGIVVLEFDETASFAVTYAEGWGLVSLPVGAADPDYLAVFEGGAGGDPQSPVYVVPNTFYEFDGAYYTPDPPELTPGVGAWLKFAQEAAVTIDGDYVGSLDRVLGAGGWYLFGGPSCSLPVSVLESYVDVVDGTVYGFDGAYFTPTTLEPGRSYWAKVADGASPTITLACGEAAPAPLLAAGARGADARGASARGAGARSAGAQEAGGRTRSGAATAHAVMAHAVTPEPDLSAFGALTVADAEGRARTLHFGAALGEVEHERFALPPVPPAGAFDARLDGPGGGTRLTESPEARVLVQASALPLVVTADALPTGSPDSGYMLDVVVEGVVVSTHALEPGSSVEVQRAPSGLVLDVRPVAAVELPSAFVLRGAYPNPFRGEAIVSYDLPEEADVRLAVYDVLGRRVAVVEEASVEAGPSRSLRLRARGLASGAYVYRLEASMASGTVSAVGRLTVVR